MSSGMAYGDPPYYQMSAAGGWTCPNCGQWCWGFHNCPRVVNIPTVWVEPQTERKPHVCPVCTGKGRVPSSGLSADSAGDECPACHGACVLWG